MTGEKVNSIVGGQTTNWTKKEKVNYYCGRTDNQLEEIDV